MKQLLIFSITILFNITISSQTQIGRAIMEHEIDRNNEKLILNGAGVRSLTFIELYTGGLYLKNKSKDPIAICYENETMSIRIKVTSKLITRDKMVSAIQEGFIKSTGGNMEGLVDRMKLIETYYNKDVKKGDIIELAYIKDIGTKCLFNDKELGLIPGQDFKFILFKVWLGEKPPSKKLKKGMLGF